MNSKVLQTLEKGYIRLDWSEYINRVYLTTDHLNTIVDMIDNFKSNRGAKELIIFRFQGIPAYVMIKREEYPNILLWIKDKLVEREAYEGCQHIVNLLSHINKSNVRRKRNMESLEDSRESNAGSIRIS
jgi:hypothetical protein